ncbi:MAG: hypothetical protein Faunusvirus44_1, partial [Faunusvirus sp.]
AGVIGDHARLAKYVVTRANIEICRFIIRKYGDVDVSAIYKLVNTDYFSSQW